MKGASDGGPGGGQDGLVGQARSNEGQSRTVDTVGAVGGIQRDIFKTEPWAPHPLLDMMNKKNNAGMSSWDTSLEAGWLGRFCQRFQVGLLPTKTLLGAGGKGHQSMEKGSNELEFITLQGQRWLLSRKDPRTGAQDMC